MRFVSTPLQFVDSGTKLRRDIENRMQMLDNLVELIVFTPRGDFEADPDFGFEYWNHEYSNVHYREFNNEQTGMLSAGLYNEITKKECQESIRQSLSTYAPQLKQVIVSMELNSAEVANQRKKKVPSKYIVTIKVDGIIEDGLGTTCKYEKDVMFLMEPTAKKYRI
jgi:hypothetical protein